jgi:hypothetical protein
MFHSTRSRSVGFWRRREIGIDSTLLVKISVITVDESTGKKAARGVILNRHVVGRYEFVFKLEAGENGKPDFSLPEDSEEALMLEDRAEDF